MSEIRENDNLEKCNQPENVDKGTGGLKMRLEEAMMIGCKKGNEAKLENADKNTDEANLDTPKQGEDKIAGLKKRLEDAMSKDGEGHETELPKKPDDSSGGDGERGARAPNEVNDDNKVDATRPFLPKERAFVSLDTSDGNKIPNEGTHADKVTAQNPAGMADLHRLFQDQKQR
jgi:hypothetical protein